MCACAITAVKQKMLLITQGAMYFHEDQAHSALRQGASPVSSRSLDPPVWRWWGAGGLPVCCRAAQSFGVQAGVLLEAEHRLASAPSSKCPGQRNRHGGL